MALVLARSLRLMSGDAVINRGEDEGGNGAVHKAIDGADHDAGDRVGCMEPRVDGTGHLKKVQSVAWKRKVD